MKKAILFLSVFSFLHVSSQVGIGTTNVSSSEALSISSRLAGESATAPGRGFLPSRVSLTGETDAVTIPNPAHALAVYNTNGLPGFFYWDSLQNPQRWRRLMDVPGVMELMVPVKNYSSASTGGASQGTGVGTAVGYTIGEHFSVRPWVKVPGMERTINIYSADNNVTIVGSIPLQINNSGTENTYDVHSYAVGLFVNDRLVSVRPFVMSAVTRMNCAIKSVEIKTNLSNLTAGNHKVEMYVITRSDLVGSATTLTWGAPATGCTTQNGFMATGNISVQTQQF